MNRSLPCALAAAVLAIGTLGAAAAAHAGPSVHVSINVPPPVHVHPQPVQVAHEVHVPAYEVHDTRRGYGHDRGYRHDPSWQEARGVPRWDPRVRYMPGQVVWRKGDVFVARRVSARVWNVNSPPEWTPQYWAPADLR